MIPTASQTDYSKIITAASNSPHGRFALMILILGGLAAYFFRHARVEVRVGIYVLLLFAVGLYGYAVDIAAKTNQEISSTTPPRPPTPPLSPTTCEIADKPLSFIEHNGVTDPLREGFQSGRSQVGGGSAVGNAMLANWNKIKVKPFRDGKSWFISNPLIGAEPYFAPLTIDLSEIKRWRMTLKAEIINLNPAGGIFASLDNGSRRFDLNVIPAHPDTRNAAELKARWNTDVRSPTDVSGDATAPFDNGHSVTTYELTYDLASQFATLCVDGEVLRHDVYEGHKDYVTGPQFAWGASGGSARFTLARFEVFK